MYLYNKESNEIVLTQLIQKPFECYFRVILEDITALDSYGTSYTAKYVIADNYP
jgi:hypothetical protein